MKLKAKQVTASKSPAVARITYITERGIATATVFNTGIPSKGTPSAIEGRRGQVMQGNDRFVNTIFAGHKYTVCLSQPHQATFDSQ